MKKFLTLTLVLFLSLFIVGESEAIHSKDKIDLTHNVMTGGEVLGSQYVEEDTTRGFSLLVRYNGNLYWCDNFKTGIMDGDRLINFCTVY